MSRTGIETIISLSPNFLYVLYVLSQRALPDISLFGRLLTTTAGYAQPAHNSAGRLFAISDKLTAVTKVLEPSLGNSDLACHFRWRMLSFHKPFCVIGPLSIGRPGQTYGHPLPFGRICLVVLVMRKGGESSWSGPWHLGCTSEIFHTDTQLPGPVHTARLGRVCFYI